MSAVIELDEPRAPEVAAPEEPTRARSPLPRPSPMSVRRIARVGLVVLAVTVLAFGVWVAFVSGLVQARAQDGLERRFRGELAEATAPVNQPIAVGAPIAVLDIPALALHQVVVEGTRARQLAKGPGHLRTSALPGQPGVSVVIGRKLAFGGPFRHLGGLAAGDEMTVTTGQGRARYKVVSTRRYGADDGDAFLADGDSLVLVTSDPAVFAARRLVVRAVPVGKLHDAGARAAGAPVTTADLGLEGETQAAVGLLVWLELLAVAACATVVLFRRWNRRAAWIIAVPVLAACTWMVFAQLALLAPATL